MRTYWVHLFTLLTPVTSVESHLRLQCATKGSPLLLAKSYTAISEQVFCSEIVSDEYEHRIGADMLSVHPDTGELVFIMSAELNFGLHVLKETKSVQLHFPRVSHVPPFVNRIVNVFFADSSGDAAHVPP